jgi:hypothetical protein
MTGRSVKSPRSHLATAALAAATLYWVFDLSRSGRTAIDWIVLGMVEEGAVLPGVWDVFAQAGEPIERVHGFEVSAQGGVHPRAVDDRSRRRGTRAS